MLLRRARRLTTSGDSFEQMGRLPLPRLAERTPTAVCRRGWDMTPLLPELAVLPDGLAGERAERVPPPLPGTPPLLEDLRLDGDYWRYPLELGAALRHQPGSIILQRLQTVATSGVCCVVC